MTWVYHYTQADSPNIVNFYERLGKLWSFIYLFFFHLKYCENSNSISYDAWGSDANFNESSIEWNFAYNNGMKRFVEFPNLVWNNFVPIYIGTAGK